MKQVETHVFELSLKDLLRLPSLWQILVFNRQTGLFTLSTAGNCSTQGASHYVFFAFDLPQSVEGGV